MQKVLLCFHIFKARPLLCFTTVPCTKKKLGKEIQLYLTQMLTKWDTVNSTVISYSHTYSFPNVRKIKEKTIYIYQL